MEQVKNDKVFFHVFPTLKAEDDIQILFADVEVKKITTNSRRDFLHVHIFSRHLIQKKQIWQMEQRIKDQLFAKTPVSIRIIEEYALSGQYTPEALMDETMDEDDRESVCRAWRFLLLMICQDWYKRAGS